MAVVFIRFVGVVLRAAVVLAVHQHVEPVQVSGEPLDGWCDVVVVIVVFLAEWEKKKEEEEEHERAY